MPRLDPFEEVMRHMSVDERKFINDEYKKHFKQRLATQLGDMVDKEVKKLLKELGPGIKKKVREDFEKAMGKDLTKLFQKAMKKVRINITQSYY